MDKFLDVMRLNPDEDYDFDNEDYDIDEEEEEQKPRISRKEKKQKEETFEPQPQKEKVVRANPKITPITKSTRKQALGMEVCVIKPISMEDEIEITDTLLNGTTVILNMEATTQEI